MAVAKLFCDNQKIIKINQKIKIWGKIDTDCKELWYNKYADKAINNNLAGVTYGAVKIQFARFYEWKYISC